MNRAIYRFFKVFGRYNIGMGFQKLIDTQVVRYSFDLVRENIQMYQIFNGTQLQDDFYGFFATGIFLYGGIILLMAYMMAGPMYILTRLTSSEIRAMRSPVLFLR